MLPPLLPWLLIRLSWFHNTLFVASCFKIPQNSPKPSGALEHVGWRWRSSVPGVVRALLARAPQSTSDQGLAYSPLRAPCWDDHEVSVSQESSRSFLRHRPGAELQLSRWPGTVPGNNNSIPCVSGATARFHLTECLRQRPIGHVQSRSEITGESQKCHNQMLLFNLKSFCIRQEKLEQGQLRLNL